MYRYSYHGFQYQVDENKDNIAITHHIFFQEFVTVHISKYINFKYKNRI